MLETALVMTLLLGTLMGVCDFGQALFLHQGLVNQARYGVRYAAVNYTNLDVVKNRVVYNSNEAPPVPYGGPVPPGYLGLLPSMVTVTRVGENTNDDRITITISNYPYNFYSPWLANAFRMAPITLVAPVEVP